MKKFLENKKIMIIFCFIILYMFGFCFLYKINGNFDENLEQQILKSNVKDYAELIHFDRLINHYNEMGIQSISLNSEKDHGIAPYYLFVPFFMLINTPSHLSLVWHLYTYSIFFLGVVYLFFLAKYLTNNRKIAVITTLLYYFSPRILIDSMNNNKDIVLMSLLIVMIYYGLKMIKEPNLKYVLLFSIISGFVGNIKIIGLFFLFVIGLFYIIYYTIKKKWSKQIFLYGLLAAIISMIVFIIVTPAIWGNGKFEIIDYFMYCFSNGVQFRDTISVLFEGSIYGDISLPWYYILKMITITLPIITIITFVVSLILLFINIIKKYKKGKYTFLEFSISMVISMFIVLNLVFIIKRPNIYNGWRHFYFLYSMIIIISIYGINYIYQKKNLKNIFVILATTTFAVNIFYLLKYNVANTAYYNILVGRNDLSSMYELDYYNVTGKESIIKFMNSDKYIENDDGYLYLYGKGFNNRIISDVCTYNEKFNEKIIIVKEDEIDRYKKDGKIIYRLANSVYSINDKTNDKLVYTYKMFNNNITKFYEIN